MCNKFLDFPVYIFSGKIYLCNKRDYRITFLNLKSGESYSGLGLLGGSYCCRTKVGNFKKKTMKVYIERGSYIRMGMNQENVVQFIMCPQAFRMF